MTGPDLPDPCRPTARPRAPESESSDDPQSRCSPTGPSPADPVEEHGAAQALARARAAAQLKGLRPGRRGTGARDRPAPAKRDGASPAAGSQARDPMLIGDVFGRLLSSRGWDSDLAVGSIMGRWPVIVGIEVARHCSPERFERGVLTIRAESSAWAAQLRTFSSTVLELVEREVGTGLVLELRIIGPGGPSWRRGPLRVRGPGPRDTYG